MTDSDVDARQMVDRLRSEPLFAGFDGQQLARLTGGLRTRQAADGETVVQAGDEADFLMLVMQGDLQLHGQDGHPLGNAQRLGEEALTGQSTYLSSAHAVGDTVLLTIPRTLLNSQKLPIAVERANRALLTRLTGMALPLSGAKAPRAQAKVARRETWGWGCTLFTPLAVLALGLANQWNQNNTLFLAILSATVCMWIFSLVDEYIPPLFATAAMLLVDLAPTEVVLSGFASSGLLLFVGVYVLGGVMVASGLSYRIILWLRSVLPDSPFWHGAALVLSGYALSPILPSGNARMTLILPLYRDLCSAGNLEPGSLAQTRLAAATFCGSMNMSPMFLTSKSSNLIVFAMLPTQLQDEFQGLFWFIGAIVCAAVMTGGHFVLDQWFFRGDRHPPVSKTLVKQQVALLGPLGAEEKLTLLALVLFLGGAVTIMWHHISLPWVAGFILVALLLYGLVSKQNFQQYVDWPMVFFLLSLQGLTSTMEYLHLLEQIQPWIDVVGTMLEEDISRLILLTLAVVLIVRLALPITAGMVVSAILLMPLAGVAGVNPWIIGFLAAMFSDIWLMPYQSSQYAQLRSAQPPHKRFDEPLFLRYNLATCVLRLIAVYASIPYWDYLELI